MYKSIIYAVNNIRIAWRKLRLGKVGVILNDLVIGEKGARLVGPR